MKYRIRDLPFWMKTLVAPAAVLAAMLAMAALTLVNLRHQEADVSNLNAIAFERLRRVMSVNEVVDDFQADLYRLSATAATESDKSKVDAAARDLKTRLVGVTFLVRSIAGDSSAALEDSLVGYDWAAQQMIAITQFDAAYGVMMMGYAQEYFSQLRRLLSAATEQAQEQRDAAATDLLAALARTRVQLLALLVAGAGLSVQVALMIARAISIPTVRLTRTMARLASGELEVEIPDQDRRDEIGAMARAVQVFKEDMAKRQRLTSQIAHLAHHDTLTGLPNRVLFQETLERALSGRRQKVALHCLDLDQFKAVNDALGHHIGDRLLQAAARRLCRGSRQTDTVARLGGDEFAIVQTGMNSAAEVTGLASRLIELISEPFEIDGHHIVVGVSIGIAFAPRDASDAEDLLKCADMALYRAKDDGRGVCRLFEPAMDAAMQARHGLESDLRQALTAGQLELHYQPLIDLTRRRVAGCEALLRWRHPTRGLLLPDVFIPLAEETGLIVPIGEWVLARACADAAGWPQGMKVAVNLSAIQLRNRRLTAAIGDALRDSGLAPMRLELEITETALLQDAETTLDALHRLRDLGVQITLDDFGTGHSSLSYLRRFPFDRIKIDRTFTRELGRQADCGAIVRAVTALGGELGMAVTGEGVETSQQLDTLTRAGCNEVQGYLFSPAVPPEAVMDVIRSMTIPGGTGATEDTVSEFEAAVA